MKLYLSTLALTLLLAFLADTTITWRPFNISFGRPWQAVGVLFILCGIVCLYAGWYNEGLKRGAEIKKEVIEEIKQEEIKSSL